MTKRGIENQRGFSFVHSQGFFFLLSQLKLAVKIGALRKRTFFFATCGNKLGVDETLISNNQ
jgi:hypothetical protein